MPILRIVQSARRTRPVEVVAATLLVGVTVGLASTARAQTEAPARPAAPATARPAPSPPPAYSYDPGGRRDPFVSLAAGAVEQRGTATRPPGLAGVAVGELSLRGIIENRGEFVAMIQAPDKKSYLIRTGDRLFDATVKAVASDAVVFVQEVTDPLSLVKQREIRRPLRPVQEAR